MASRRRWPRVKAWLLHFFTPEDVTSTPDHDRFPRYSRQDFVRIQKTTVNKGVTVKGKRNVVEVKHSMQVNGSHEFMSIFSQRIMSGVSYRDSARGSVPRCHPETRANIISRIKSWLDGEGPEELLLWITGPAGVGKSAIVQTLAEHLAENNSLGASLFFSRPGGRNDPQLVFITIAYRLATQIEAYRNFLIERLDLDPDLLNTRMDEQFRTFILEPFREKKFEAGGRRWGILLDGLDELEGEDAQRNVIQLISTFAHAHRDAPLVWIISSRSEPNIFNTFDDDDVRQGSWQERILIDSPESREDVDRFLRSSFEATRKRFKHSLPKEWPDKEAITKIAAAASGLFIYAELVMQFIRDPKGRDPDDQLRILLLGIDQSTKSPDPFVRLDEFYSKILSENSWPTKEKLLRFVIQWEQLSVFIPKGFNTLRGMSIFFGLTRTAIYGCLEECYSTLKIPEWHVSHQENLAFLHESFAEYLTDAKRSQGFHISTGGAKDDTTLRLFEIWDECSGSDIAIVSVESSWHQYCLKRDRTQTPAIRKFHVELYHDLVHCLKQLVIDSLTGPGVPLIQEQLHKINLNKLCYCLNPHDFWDFALALLANYSNDLNDGVLVQGVQLRNLNFAHLDCKDMSPAHAHIEVDGTTFKYILRRPPSTTELQQFVSELESIRESSPEIHAFIYGGAPKGRVTAFRYPLQNAAWRDEDFKYYILPCPK